MAGTAMKSFPACWNCWCWTASKFSGFCAFLMAGPLIDIITSTDPQTRNRSLDSVCRSASREELVAAGAELDAFQRRSDNLYERVRALFFLYAIHRFYLPCKPGVRQ